MRLTYRTPFKVRNMRKEAYRIMEMGKVSNALQTVEQKEGNLEETALNIKDFIKAVGDNAKKHGFRDANTKPADFLALIHSEVSEVLEEFRNGHIATETYYRVDGKPEGVPAELADVVIRCFDMADAFDIDLEAAILEKHEFNMSREYLHGKRF